MVAATVLYVVVYEWYLIFVRIPRSLQDLKTSTNHNKSLEDGLESSSPSLRDTSESRPRIISDRLVIGHGNNDILEE